ncbi:major antigen-like [Tropilaelaps mercedesae]|uniref:Major antigen-like n=1 Tax=Tropilaelaps mercedesae TaxID=418985 RepID=A0A1V9XN66_9ACAR|nr:major antigen-like [Tropilaelaps mercedesae]
MAVSWASGTGDVRASAGLASEPSEDLRSLAKRNATLEQKCESLKELKDKIMKLEIEKRDARAENTQLKGKNTSLQRDKKQLIDRLASVENESSAKLKELKDAQTRHLEMLSKLRRTYTKIEAKYKHLLKERAQWQSLFRTANGELSKSTESLASISSVASSSVSRASFFRDSSNLEEYNIHLESELVAAKESLKISEKERERIEKKFKTLTEQVLHDENLITELDHKCAQLMTERDGLRESCRFLEENNVTLQRNIDELREQLDTALFENNEMSMREDEARLTNLCDGGTTAVDSTDDLQVIEDQTVNVETLANFVNNVMTSQERVLINRLDVMDANITFLTKQCETAKSRLLAKDMCVKQQQQTIAELNRQVEVLKNNAESLAKDLGAEVRERSVTEIAKMQDEISAQNAKLNDYEKMQKVLKKALEENETLKVGASISGAKIEAAESRIVELENQLKCEQQLLTESNGRLNQRLRQAERENERLQGEFAVFEERITELGLAKDALAATESDRKALQQQVASLEASLAEVRSEERRVQEELERIADEHKHCTETFAETSSIAEGLKMTSLEKAQQIAAIIKDLEAERAEKSALEKTVLQLRQDGEKLMGENDQKMATLTAELKAANLKLEDVLQQKALQIETLEQQMFEASTTKQRQIDDLLDARRNEAILQDNVKATCATFADALRLDVDHSVAFSEFLPQMTSAALDLVASKTKQLEDANAELERALRAAEEGASFANTVQQLQDQLGKDEESLKRYEEALATQSASIDRMKTERAELERRMTELRDSDCREIEELRANLHQLEGQLSESQERAEKVASLEGRCAELEAQYKATISDKNDTITELEDRLGKKILEIDGLSQKVQAFSVMEERLDAMTVEAGQCREKMAELQKDVDDKEQKLCGKNQVICELEKELSEKIATFDEMEKVFTLKGEEYKKLRDTLIISEDTIKSLSSQLASADATVKQVCSKLLPDVTQDTAEMWLALSARADDLLAELSDVQEKSKSLEAELEASVAERNAVNDQANHLQRISETLQAELDKANESIETFTSLTDTLNADLTAERSSVADALATVGQLKAANETLTSKVNAQRDELENNANDIKNLQKLLAESESAMRDLSEQNTEEAAYLKDRIESLNLQQEELQARLDQELEERAVASQTSASVQAALNAEVDRLSTERESLLVEKRSLEEGQAELEARLSKAEASHAEKCLELEELTKVLAEKQSDMVRFEEKLHALKDRYGDRVQSLQKNLSRLHKDKAELSQQVELIRQELKAAAAAQEELETSLQNKCESLEVLQGEMDLLEGKLQETCSRYEDSQQKLDARDAEVARLLDSIASVNMALSERSENVNSYHDQVKALAEEKIRLEAEAAELKRRIENNSEEYQSEALEMQQELSIMTERYNIKCHECESLWKDIATKATDVDVLSAKLLAMESDLSKATSHSEALEKTLTHERNQFEGKLAEATALKDCAFATTKHLEKEMACIRDESKTVSRQLKAVTSELDQTRDDKNKLATMLHVSDGKISELRGSLLKTTNQLERTSTSQMELQLELGSVRQLLLDYEKRERAARIEHDKQLHTLREELRGQLDNEESLQRTLRQELEAMRESVAVKEQLLEQQAADSVISLHTIQDKLNTEKYLNQCYCREKAALEEELAKVQSALKEAQDRSAEAEVLRSDLTESIRKRELLDEHLMKLRRETKEMQHSIDALTKEKAILDARDTQWQDHVRTLQGHVDALQLAELDQTKQLAAARRDISDHHRILDEIRETLAVKSSDGIVPLLRRQKATIAQLGSGVLMIGKELRDQQQELGRLRQLVTMQRGELSVFVSDAGRQLLAMLAYRQTPECKVDRDLVNRCLEVLRRNNIQALTRPATLPTQATPGEDTDGSRPMHGASAPSLDEFDMHFQTFNGPTAQFVAEQQASSAARRKLTKLTAAMDHDDTAPPAHVHSDSRTDVPHRGGHPHQELTNGDSSPEVSPLNMARIDPFETIKQQKILIHELMSKFETTKKVLDGEMARRKILDERVRLWLSDKRLHNAQVSFSVAQTMQITSGGQGDDTFVCYD